MGGWWRKEIKTVEDLKGIKFRIGGLGGAVLGKPASPRRDPGGDIYPASKKERSTAEWVGPYDDEKLGFYKVAKYYYYPGWWRATQASAYINWGSGTSCRRPIRRFDRACAEADPDDRKVRYRKRPALRRLVANGAQLRPFSREILDACYKAAQEVYAEYSANNPQWNAIYEPWKKFLDDEGQWFRVNEQQFDNYMLSVKKS